MLISESNIESARSFRKMAIRSGRLTSMAASQSAALTPSSPCGISGHQRRPYRRNDAAVTKTPVTRIRLSTSCHAHFRTRRIAKAPLLAKPFHPSRVKVQPGRDRFRKSAIKPRDNPVGTADQVRRDERGKCGNSHCDRIKKTAGYLQAEAKRGDDEGEFADLRQTHADTQRGRSSRDRQ